MLGSPNRHSCVEPSTWNPAACCSSCVVLRIRRSHFVTHQPEPHRAPNLGSIPAGGTDEDLLARLTAVCEASAHRVSTSDQFDSQYSFSRSSAAAAAASGCWRSIRVIRRDPNGPCLATDCAHVTTEPPSDPSTEYVECTNP